MSDARQRLSRVSKEHVEQACRQLARAEVRGGGSYFVPFEGKELPAKRVLREAYRVAYGEELDAKSFSGGVYTQRILEGLGFNVVVRDSPK